jgi:hypothetical protein
VVLIKLTAQIHLLGRLLAHLAAAAQVVGISIQQALALLVVLAVAVAVTMAQVVAY